MSLFAIPRAAVTSYHRLNSLTRIEVIRLKLGCWQGQPPSALRGGRPVPRPSGSLAPRSPWLVAAPSSLCVSPFPYGHPPLGEGPLTQLNPGLTQ